MKKIVNIMILIMISLLPVMADAKANLTFEKDFMYELFLYEEDNKSYFLDLESEEENGTVNIYDKDGNFIDDDLLIIETDSVLELYSYRPHLEYLKKDLHRYWKSRLYKVDNYLYTIRYLDESIHYSDLKDEDDTDGNSVSFSDNIDFTKEVLGKKYDIFYHYKNLNYEVWDIMEYDNYYVVEYYDEEDKLYSSVIDENLNILLNFEFVVDVYIHDGLVYVKNTNEMVDLYKLDGTKIQSLNISHDLIDKNNNDEEECKYLEISDIEIYNNNLYLTYLTNDYCVARLNYNDAKDFGKESDLADMVTLKYSLDFDVEKVNSNNGDFTYETKEDEDGKSYVELKITPKDGYSVKEIIVTDFYGNRIEVTNNKFYKPLNDVKIEVKYVLGEYLPIPDTFLSKSITLIIIGFILVGLGVYTINYVRGESKVDI